MIQTSASIAAKKPEIFASFEHFMKVAHAIVMRMVTLVLRLTPYGVFALMFALQVLVVQFGGAMFRTVPLPIDMWLKIIAVGFGVVVLQEVIKTVKRAAAAIRARRTANESDSQQPHQPIALDLVD